MSRGCWDEASCERRSAAGYAWMAVLTVLIGGAVVTASVLGHPPDYARALWTGLITLVLAANFVRCWVQCNIHAKVAEVKQSIWPLQLLAWLFWRR